jgi:hypothetical protein
MSGLAYRFKRGRLGLEGRAVREGLYPPFGHAIVAPPLAKTKIGRGTARRTRLAHFAMIAAGSKLRFDTP